MEPAADLSNIGGTAAYITNDCFNKNLFPYHLIKMLKENYLTKVNVEAIPTSESQNIHYFKQPYVGKHSELLSKKINVLISKYCKYYFARIVFTSFKIGTYFSPKDQLPLTFRLNVVNKFKYANFNVSYIGETSRHIKSRIEEHTRKDISLVTTMKVFLF